MNEDNKKTHFEWVNKNDLGKVNLLPEVLREWSKTDGFDKAVLRP